MSSPPPPATFPSPFEEGQLSLYGLYYYGAPTLLSPISTPSRITTSDQPFTLLGTADSYSLSALHFAARCTASALQITHGWAPREYLNDQRGGYVDLLFGRHVIGTLKIEGLRRYKGRLVRVVDSPEEEGNGKGSRDGKGGSGGGDGVGGMERGIGRPPAVGTFRV